MLDRRRFLQAGAGVSLLGMLGGNGVGLAVVGADWGSLRRSLEGELFLPADSGYQLAKQLAFRQFDSISPQAVAYCTTPQDVATCIRFAQDNEISATPRSGGHSYGGYSTSPGLVIDVSRMNAVRPGQETIHLGPGAQSVDVAAALAPHNTQVVSGLCPTVCPGGYILGGGIGWQTRKFGLGSDRLVGADVVLADGRLVHTSEQSEPDLFWALRGGGGGNFGIVTNFEVRPTQVPTMVNFNLTWKWDDFLAVLEAWQPWVIHGGADLACSLGVQIADAAPGTVPQVIVNGGYLGAKSALEAKLDELVANAGRQPATRTSTDELSYQEAMMQTFGCADFTVDECHRVGYSPEAMLPRGAFTLDRNRMLSQPLTPAAAEDVARAHTAQRRAGQFRYLNLMALGYAANDVGRTDTAYVHRDSLFFAGYSVGLNGEKPTEEDKQAATEWAAQAFSTIDRYSNGESYQNFIDPALRDWKTAYYAENYPRLLEIKHRYDPDNFFRFSQGIA